MISLRSQPTLNIFQFLFPLFHNLKQKVYDSTLWVCDRGISQPFRLDLQITPETVLVKGERLDPLEYQNYSESEFPAAARFQSLIPLPSSIQPQNAIADLNGTTLTLTMMKSSEPQRTAKITVGDRAQPLLCAMAINAELVHALAEFN